MIKIFILVISCFITINVSFGQSAHKSLRDGDMLYGYGRFAEAEKEYRKADASQSSVKSAYNLGNALMNQERFDEAAKKYEDALSKAQNDQQRSEIYYNQGNSLYKKQKFQESINAYKNALKYNPEDMPSKENLAIARRELKKLQQQQKKEQNKDQNQDQNKENKDQSNQKNDSQDQDKNNQDQNQDQQSQDQNQDQNQDQKPKDGQKMSKEDAQKLLEIMDNEEKKVQQKMRRIDGKNKKVKKDW